MKIINIQRHFFRLKSEPKKLYFCTEAECDYDNNVKVIRYVRANKDYSIASSDELELRGKEISKVVPIAEALGMAYNPASDARKLGTQTPDSMGYDIHEALKQLIKAVGGNVTDFVCERLQWSRAEIEDRLFAEQVDAVALAIYNFESRKQAMIIGDQTGIGKGRIASSIIRYAMVQGYIPIYCTENAGLFSDNYRDLTDIGCKAIPFIINSQTSGKSDARIMTLNEQDENVSVFKKTEKGYPITDRNAKNEIFESGELPAGYDYVLTTYSQLKNAFKVHKDKRTDGEDILKYNFLKSLAPKAIFIFDESHNVSGSKIVAKNWYDPSEGVELAGSNQFYCFNDLAKIAHNVLFLSATFAKRPENLVVYANRTCIADAGLKDYELVDAIANGGEALQEIISSDIVHEGQMIRRESIYKGIKVRYLTLDKSCANEGVPDLEAEHRAKCDYITSILNRINVFEQKYLSEVLAQRNEDAMQSGEFDSKTSKQMGASHTPIFSKLFNIVNQLLFAIKAKAVAEHAIRRLREGKKVVIGLSSTMESFLDKLEIENGVEVKSDFTLVLEEAVKSAMKIRKRDLETGQSVGEPEYISISELSAEGQDYYIQLQKDIENASSGISISPIDLITETIQAATNENGKHYVVSEVTGRSRKFMFSNTEGTVGQITKRDYVTRNVAFSQFQNNQSDVLIINASGATGASAHATTKNTNLTEDEVKARVMIIAQTELDVNKEVQKRGRINRTGQIPTLPPSYDYISSAIPAEKRLMMMLQKKLKSLDANSTSNQKQSTNVIDTSDFMNKYGNIVCAQYLRENPEINAKLNDPLNQEDADAPAEGGVDISKITGYVPLLTCKEQEEFYDSILERYQKLVENLQLTGDYDLEVEAMDLDAELQGKLSMIQPPSDGESRFSDAVYVGNFDCKILRKPFSQSEVKVMLEQYLNGENAKEKAKAIADDMRKWYDEQMVVVRESMQQQAKEKIEEFKAKVKEKGGNNDDAAIGVQKLKDEFDKKYASRINRLKVEKSKAGLIEFFHAGRASSLFNHNAICLGTKVLTKTKSPFAGSNVEISFAVASAQKLMTFNLTVEDVMYLQKIKDSTESLSGSGRLDYEYLDRWTEYIREATGDREVRQIIVGNILRAYKTRPDHSRLISFTMKSGEIQKGILVPRRSTASEADLNSVVSKYPIERFESIFKDLIGDGQKYMWNLNRGVTVYLNYKNLAIVMEISDKKTYSKITEFKYDDFAKLDYRARTLTEEGYGKNTRWVVYIEEPKYLKKFIDLMASLSFCVELFPSQVEKYFGGTKKLKQGNWKPLRTDKSKIPASKPSEPDKPAITAAAKAKALVLMRLKLKLVEIMQIESDKKPENTDKFQQLETDMIECEAAMNKEDYQTVFDIIDKYRKLLHEISEANGRWEITFGAKSGYLGFPTMGTTYSGQLSMHNKDARYTENVPVIKDGKWFDVFNRQIIRTYEGAMGRRYQENRKSGMMFTVGHVKFEFDIENGANGIHRFCEELHNNLKNVVKAYHQNKTPEGGWIYLKIDYLDKDYDTASRFKIRQTFGDFTSEGRKRGAEYVWVKTSHEEASKLIPDYNQYINTPGSYEKSYL